MVSMCTILYHILSFFSKKVKGENAVQSVYQLIVGVVTVEGRSKTTYGIELCNHSNPDENIRVPDLSFNLDKIKQWIFLMNQFNLPQLHFSDIVDDILWDL